MCIYVCILIYIIPADKKTNFYKPEPSPYNYLMEKNIMKSYISAEPELTHAIHEKNKGIAQNLTSMTE